MRQVQRQLQRFGKFYGNVILNFIGIFIFVGMLAVLFGENGWFPNEEIYAVSRMGYRLIIPVLIAYAGGTQMRGVRPRRNTDKNRDGNLQFMTEGYHAGGVIAVMAVSGILIADPGSGILGAMILGPLSGVIWENLISPRLVHVKTGVEMLTRNLFVAFTGSILTVLSFYVLAPVISTLMNVLMIGTNYLIDHNLICFVSFIIEPSKILFLNNSINHGVLLPLGLQQAGQAGESMLFLLESNPGPGLGMLMALYLKRKDRRKDYLVTAFTEFIGGLHEVYFPEALANISLLIALIFGGTAGNLTFSMMHAATTAPVSPGSIFSVLCVTSRYQLLPVLTGILVSALVSFFTAGIILNLQQTMSAAVKTAAEDAKPAAEDTKAIVKDAKPAEDTKPIVKDAKPAEDTKAIVKDVKPAEDTKLAGDVKPAEDAAKSCIAEGKVRKIGFICDAGVGSSAMAAALFRRKLKERHLEGIEVTAYARDQVPEDLSIAVCQRDFWEHWKKEIPLKQVYTLSSLVAQAEYDVIIEQIIERNGGSL